MVTLFKPDYTDTVNIPTSNTGDASATIPIINSGKMIDQSSWWFIVVAGCDAYLNFGAAALNDGTCAWIPVSTSFPALPHKIAPGTVVHALGTGGKGQVSFIRATTAE